MVRLPVNYMDRRATGKTALRQCQLVQLHILHAIDKICTENKIEYFLESGTLLGALRHDGFIPWDDDLDIGMTLPNYRKFLKLAPTLLPDNLYIQDPKDYPHIAISFAKIRDKNSFYYECRSDTRANDPTGIYVDIFPYEELPNVPKALQFLLLGACSSTWSRARYYANIAADHPVCSPLYSVASLLLLISHSTIRLIVALLKLIPNRKYWAFQYERSTRHRRFRRDWIASAVPHKFEDADFPIPIGSDEILKVWYGNWHEIPPPEKRPRHARIIDPFHAATA